MLVIAFKAGDHIVIDKNITVKVLKNKKGSLKFVVSAPEHIKVEKIAADIRMPGSSLEISQ